MLDGVVPFPPEFARRYREKGYWRDLSLAEEFAPVFRRHAERVAVVDRDARVTYAEIDRVSDRLALNLLDAGLVPLDRVVVQLPNVAEFVFLYFALQKIGCIPIAALATHRFLEVSQFAKLSGAAACVTPDRYGDFDFREMVRRVRNETPSVRLGIVLGEAPAGVLSLADLISRDPKKLPEDLVGLIERQRVTHLKVVPALLIRLINDPDIVRYDLSSLRVIQSGGQRMQPEVRIRTKQLIPSATVQENFGMSEGMLFFVRLDDPDDVRLETCGRPLSPDDEVRLVDEEGREVPRGEVGELTCRGPYTLRGYYGVPEYNARQFTPEGFYRSGDLMRLHPSGNYVVEGRKKDLINRAGEKISTEEIENLILGHPAVRNIACEIGRA